MKVETLLVLISVVASQAFPAVHNHMNKRQSYGRSNQLVPTQDQYYGQPSYNNYQYDRDQGRYYDNFRGNNYYDYPPSSRYYGREQGFSNVNPMEREINVRNGQLRQKEYQKRTGQEGRDTYDPFYFYVNPVANPAGPPLPPQPQPAPQGEVSTSSSVPGPTQVTAALHEAPLSREHVLGGPPRNRRNSLGPPRDYFDNEISGDKYEILTSKPNYPRQNSYREQPQYGQRYSTVPSLGGYNHPPPGNPNQFLNYEQIVGAQPPRYANGQPPRSQPWSIQIGTQLKVKDDGKGPNASRYYVRDERKSRARQPLYRK